MTEKVSVVIPVLNYGRYVGAAIESALQQTLPPHEVIVVDDGSTDDTPGVLASFGHRIIVLRTSHVGSPQARNLGAARATGDVLAFLDADDLWLPRKLERQIARLRERPAAGLVHCGVVDIDASGNELTTRLDGLEGWVSTDILLWNSTVILGGGSASIMTRKAFEDAGGWDPATQPSEDWDLFYRIARRYEVLFVPEILVKYRRHGGNQSLRLAKIARASLRIMDKTFASGDPEIAPLKRRAYGNLHSVLAGSFFGARQWGHFVRHTILCLLFTPERLRHFLAYPWRWLRRRRARRFA